MIEEPQQDALATLAPRIEKQEGLIDWTRPAAAIDRHVRGMQPWPGAFTYVDGHRLGVREAHVDTRPAERPHLADSSPVDGDAYFVLACGEGTTMRVVRVQPEGKRVMTAREWRLGRRAETPVHASAAP